MKQPSVYSYTQIVDAAFELIRNKGWSGVTARAIAKKLGSSTMPIYSHIGSIEELETELRRKARNLLKDFQQRKYTEDILLNLAFGYVVFARDEKNLFLFLYMEKGDTIDPEDSDSIKTSFISEFGDNSLEVKALSELKSNEKLVQHVWIFVHGLSMLVSAGALEVKSDEIILRFLRNAGEAFYLWSKEEERRKNKKE